MRQKCRVVPPAESWDAGLLDYHKLRLAVSQEVSDIFSSAKEV